MQFFLGTLVPPLTLVFTYFSKTAISPIFRNFWRNCINRSFCWAHLYLLQHSVDLINLAKTAISPIFRNLRRNRRNCKHHSFCWAPFYLLYHLNLVILAKTAISPIFRNFCYCVQTWTYLASKQVVFRPITCTLAIASSQQT